jgi:hypothetical protein
VTKGSNAGKVDLFLWSSNVVVENIKAADANRGKDQRRNPGCKTSKLQPQYDQNIYTRGDCGFSNIIFNILPTL